MQGSGPWGQARLRDRESSGSEEGGRGWGVPPWTPAPASTRCVCGEGGALGPGLSPCRRPRRPQPGMCRLLRQAGGPQPVSRPGCGPRTAPHVAPLSVRRSGCPSDCHHHRVPHHGHRCSDYNSCLKKLVRTLGPLGCPRGRWGPQRGARRNILLFHPGPRPGPGGLVPLPSGHGTPQARPLGEPGVRTSAAGASFQSDPGACGPSTQPVDPLVFIS